MAKAYTPGLRVSARCVYRNRRVLPTPGKVLVALGDVVSGSSVIASTHLEGDVTPMKVANLLACSPKDLPGLMLKKIGETVVAGEVIARNKGMFGLMKTDVKAVTSGTIESVSDSSGMVFLRGPAQPIEILAHVDARVVEVLANEGAVVETSAALVQGIFGVGGEARGPIAIACGAADAELNEHLILPSMKGCVVVGGARVTVSAIEKAKSLGVVAIVCGGMDDADLRDFLGYDLGVAITGGEKCGLTLILTEGFGGISMARRTFELLAAHKGRVCSVNGATQIRAGVLRPEIVVPLDGPTHETDERTRESDGELAVGVAVRIIRDPYFGLLGTVSALPELPIMLDSGGKARVLEVALESGASVTVPRANVERIAT